MNIYKKKSFIFPCTSNNFEQNNLCCFVAKSSEVGQNSRTIVVKEVNGNTFILTRTNIK